MQTRNSRPHFFTQSTVAVVLILLICLATSITVQAQKKPPILTDKKISAYDVEAIKTLATAAADTTNPGAAKLARNKLIAITVEQVDTAFNDYRTKSRKRTDLLNFLFDFLEIGASSAISIVGGARPKALIGEGLSLFQGSRSAFNKDFRFMEKQILFDKMVALRSQKLAAIYRKLNDEVLQYPWEQARSELRDYFFAGTIDEALSGLSRETGAQAQSAEADLRTAKINAGIQVEVSAAQMSAHAAYQALIAPIVAGFDAQQKIIDVENEKPAAQRVQATIDNATAEQNKLTAKLKTVFVKVSENPILRPILPKIAESRPGNTLSDSQKQRIAGSLQNALENKGDFDDYLRVLQNLRGLVVDMLPTNPAPNDEFRKLLEANQ